MAPFLKALGITFGIYVLYAVVLTGLRSHGDGIVYAFFVSIVQAVISLILGLVLVIMGKEKTMWGIGFMVGAVLVVIVGFAGCLVFADFNLN